LAYVVDGKWGPFFWVLFALLWGLIMGFHFAFVEFYEFVKEQMKGKSKPDV
jgi:hypothetical protein